MKGTCELCGREGHVGPFRTDDGREFTALCGGCKVKITLTPERKARLEAEIAHAVKVVDETA